MFAKDTNDLKTKIIIMGIPNKHTTSWDAKNPSFLTIFGSQMPKNQKSADSRTLSLKSDHSLNRVSFFQAFSGKPTFRSKFEDFRQKLSKIRHSCHLPKSEIPQNRPEGSKIVKTWSTWLFFTTMMSLA